MEEKLQAAEATLEELEERRRELEDQVNKQQQSPDLEHIVSTLLE